MNAFVFNLSRSGDYAWYRLKGCIEQTLKPRPILVNRDKFRVRHKLTVTGAP